MGALSMNKNGIGKWKLTALDCGWLMGNKVNPMTGVGEVSLKLPYLAFLLQDGEQNMLIDNGINERFLIDGKGWRGLPGEGGEKHLVDALARAGLSVTDIDGVIYTHLHNDHAGNAQLFTKTTSYAQKDEWDNLLNPCFTETVRRLFDPDVIPFLRENRNFILVDGDLDLMEGIKLLKTPGHSRGSQSIVVNTVKGLRILVGDLFNLRYQCFPQTTRMMDYDGNTVEITPAPENWTAVPSLLIHDYYAYYESCNKVRSHVPQWKPEHVICSHEPSHLYGEI
jgi:glyoxylase-like metal-dependent hydrolase (beta-lactamase superfamily II)